MRQYASSRLLLPGMVLLLFPVIAFAYVDPGTGSMLLQSLLAAAAAILTFRQSLWRRLKHVLRRDEDTTRAAGS